MFYLLGLRKIGNACSVHTPKKMSEIGIFQRISACCAKNHAFPTKYMPMERYFIASLLNHFHVVRPFNVAETSPKYNMYNLFILSIRRDNRPMNLKSIDVNYIRMN